jgi:hypothetical protein
VIVEEPVTPIADTAYVTAVLMLYADLPHTACRPSNYDQTVARALYDDGVPLAIIEAALLLGSLRRCLRRPGAPPLPPIRSLAYFSPVIAELQQRPLQDSYVQYLRHKAQRTFARATASQESSPQ